MDGTSPSGSGRPAAPAARIVGQTQPESAKIRRDKFRYSKEFLEYVALRQHYCSAVDTDSRRRTLLAFRICSSRRLRILWRNTPATAGSASRRCHFRAIAQTITIDSMSCSCTIRSASRARKARGPAADRTRFRAMRGCAAMANAKPDWGSAATVGQRHSAAQCERGLPRRHRDGAALPLAG